MLRSDDNRNSTTIKIFIVSIFLFPPSVSKMSANSKLIVNTLVLILAINYLNQAARTSHVIIDVV